MKAFFSKIWSWIVGHKVVSIIISAVLVAGITCAIVLPIALKHEHSFGTELQVSDTHHYYVCECGEKKDETAHVFDKTVASSEYLKAEATATTKAQYYKSCVCGAKSATEYFETDKTAGTLANIQDISKTYDKVELANPTYETNSDGVVTIEWYQGDTKLDAKPVNAGTYKVKVIIAESATYTGISAEKEFTIAKVVVTIPTLEKEYDGYGEFEFVFEGPADEEIDCLVDIDNKNAGTYTDVAITYKSVSSENYEITATTVSATITPKVLTNISLGDATYKGSTDFSFVLSAYHGLVSGETFTLQVTTVSKNVGTAVEIASISYINNNYSIDKSAITLNIVPKALKLLDIEVTYDGGIISSFDLTAADGVIAGDDVWLYGDGWQNYDIAYDEYILTDDLSSDDYDEGVELRGADKGNYKFTYDTDGSVGKVTVMPYILDFTGEYVKDADGTHYFTFTQDVTWSHGGTNTVTVKIALIDSEGNWITAPGVYTQENAEIADEAFYIGGVKCEGFELDEDYYADEFKVTVLSTDDLVMLVTNKHNLEGDFILVVQIKQGAVKVGDSIVLTDTSDKVYEVLAIEKLNKQLEFATVGDEVGLYVSGMTDLAEVPGASFLYEKDNVPDMATEFLAEVYLKTKEEGGRQTPIFSSSEYKPNLVGLGASQEVAFTIMDVYNSDEDAMLAPGGTALVKITLTTPLPACLLETVTFNLFEVAKHVGTASVVKPVAVDTETTVGQTQLVHDPIDIAAGETVVFKITNTLGRNVTRFALWGDSARLDAKDDAYTVALYDSNGALIEATYDVDQYTFDKADSTEYAVADDQTVYVVLTLTKAVNDVVLTFY